MQNENIKIVRKVTWVGAVVNILLAALKLVVGVFSGSEALIADGFHSLSDLITDGAVLIGSHFWSADYDEKHPYGHRRIETVVSLFIAMLLAAAACGIGWNALATIREDDINHPGLIAFFAALASIIVKELLFRWTVHKGKEASSPALTANAWHHRSDALSSLPVAVAVMVAYFFPNLNYLDHIAAVLVSAMLLKAAWDIAKPCFDEILDAQADRELADVLEKIKESHCEIREFHKIRSRSCGNAVFVDLHMLVNPEMTVADSHAITRVVEDALTHHNKAIVDVTIHVEPAFKETQVTAN